MSVKFIYIFTFVIGLHFSFKSNARLPDAKDQFDLDRANKVMAAFDLVKAGSGTLKNREEALVSLRQVLTRANPDIAESFKRMNDGDLAKNIRDGRIKVANVCDAELSKITVEDPSGKVSEIIVYANQAAGVAHNCARGGDKILRIDPFTRAKPTR